MVLTVSCKNHVDMWPSYTNVIVQGLLRLFKSANTKSLSLSTSLFRMLHPPIQLHLHHSDISSVSTVSLFNSAADLLSFIGSKRKGLYTEDHTLEPLASDELKYFQEAQERVQALHEELQKASNKLTIIMINLTRKCPSRMGSPILLDRAW